MSESGAVYLKCGPCRVSSYMVGIISLILVVVLWVASSALTQNILKNYSKPFLLCFLINTTYIVYFIFLYFEDPVERWLSKARPPSPDIARNNQHTAVDEAAVKTNGLEPLTKTQIARLALVFFVLYLAANYSTNVAFGITSLGSASILAATSGKTICSLVSFNWLFSFLAGFFTLIFGWLVGVEKLNFARILAVAISVGGVMAVGWSEFGNQDNTTLGNLLALVGATLYGVYSVFLKYVSVDESRISMPLMFAFSGLFTLLLAWPILLILHYTGAETFELPPSTDVTISIIINVVLGGLIPNYLWNVAFVCTSPLAVAIGISFCIPLTLLVDHMLNSQPLWSYRLAAGLCVMVGFVILNLSDVYPQVSQFFDRMAAALHLIPSKDTSAS